jgi:hypothetical protein
MRLNAYKSLWLAIAIYQGFFNYKDPSFTNDSTSHFQ